MLWCSVIHIRWTPISSQLLLIAYGKPIMRADAGYPYFRKPPYGEKTWWKVKRRKPMVKWRKFEKIHGQSMVKFNQIKPCADIWTGFINQLFIVICALLFTISIPVSPCRSTSSLLLVPVVPHNAVAEDSEKETYRRGWFLWFRDGRANPLMDWKVVGILLFGVVTVFAVVTWSGHLTHNCWM